MVRNANWDFGNDDVQGEMGVCRSERRDLLPWADPYIVALMASLEREFLNSAIDEDNL